MKSNSTQKNRCSKNHLQMPCIVWTVLKTKKVGKTQNVTCFNLIANVLYAIKFMDSPLVLCIVCNCQGRKNQPPLSLLFCHNYSYCAVYKLTSGNCTVVKINNNPTFRLTRPFCLLVFWLGRQINNFWV